MRGVVIALVCFFFPVAATEKTIELYANFPVHADPLNRALVERGIPAHVVISDLSAYEEALRVDSSRWGKFLRALSIDLSPAAQIPEGHSKIVFWNLTHRYSHKRNLKKLPKEKLVLFMWEPPSVLQEMYAPEALSLFSKIYTWDDDLVDNKTFFKMCYPVLRPMLEELPSFEEKRLCTLMCSNLSSPHPDELYSERKKAILYFQEHEPNFVFYGRKWDAATYRSYGGAPPDAEKIDTLKHYRFSICYENMHNIKGYITEKIFDHFAAGNVPVYWGASNIAQYIPQDCFIDRRRFKSLEELHAFLKEMSKEEYEGYLQRIKAFLASERAQLFSSTHFEKTFCEAVK